MDRQSPRNITQRAYRRFRCPCPECGNLFYQSPFNLNYKGGGQNPGPTFASDPPAAVATTVNAPVLDPEDAARVLRAYHQENINCLLPGSIGSVLAKSAPRLGTLYRTWFASPAVCQATQRALQAWSKAEREPAAAVREAEAALVISPVCPEALYLLGRFKARTYHEALELFDRGSTSYDKLLNGDGWARCRQSFRYVATAPPLQGAARCMLGAIQVLCRMRRGVEAHKRMQELLQVTPPLSEAPEEDIWAIAPEVVYRAKGPATCRSWLSKHVCSEVLETGGAAVWWIATYALAWAATHQHEGFQWSSLIPFEDERVILGLQQEAASRRGEPRRAGAGGDGGPELADRWPPPPRPVRTRQSRGVPEKLRSGLALAACCCWMPHLVDMLVGDMPLPPGPVPPMCVSPGSLGAQVAYVRCCGDLWRSTPGVLDFVRRYRNTYEVFGLVADARTGRKVNMEHFRRYMAPVPLAAPSHPPPQPPAPNSTATTLPSTATAAATSTCSPSRSSSPDGAASAATATAATPGSCSRAGAAVRAANRAADMERVGIFPDAILYEGCEGWHGLVELVSSFTGFLGEQDDATMTPQDLEILRSLLAAGCPVDASKRRPEGTRGPIHSPLATAMYHGYGADVVRELLRAGADPLAADESMTVPLLVAVEQGMWRELQAVLKARRKLGPSAPPHQLWFNYSSCCASGRFWRPALPRNMFEMLLEAAIGSPCVPCVARTLPGCTRCEQPEKDGEAVLSSPHGPWCNFFKLLEVLVAYGMTKVSEPMLTCLSAMAAESIPEVSEPRRALLEHLRCLLQEAEQRRRKEADAEVEERQQAPQGQTKERQAPGGEASSSDTTPEAPPQQPEKHRGETERVQEKEPLKGTLRQLQFESKPPPQQQQQQNEIAPLMGKAVQLAGRQRSEEGDGGPRTPRSRTAAAAASPHAVLCDMTAATGPDVQPVPKLPSVAPVSESQPPADNEPPPPPAPRDKSHCWACGRKKNRAAGVKMQKCSICTAARYCGPQCQREHWPQHRQECSLLAEARARPAAGQESAGPTEAAARMKR